MESKSVAASSSGNMKLPRIVIRKELHSLIETVKKIQSVTTYEEVLDGLKVYIWQKKLYDPRNPFKICCKDDELGSVLGTKEFTIFDVKFFLQKLVFPADKSNKDCKYDNIEERGDVKTWLCEILFFLCYRMHMAVHPNKYELTRLKLEEFWREKLQIKKYH